MKSIHKHICLFSSDLKLKCRIYYILWRRTITINIIYKLKFTLNCIYPEIIYISFIHPIFAYGDKLYRPRENTLEKLQRLSARTVTEAIKLVSIAKPMAAVDENLTGLDHGRRYVLKKSLLCSYDQRETVFIMHRHLDWCIQTLSFSLETRLFLEMLTYPKLTN